MSEAKQSDSTAELGGGPKARKRVRVVERDPRGGWIARSVHTGAIYPSDDFRWNTRDGAWHAAWEARTLGEPNTNSADNPAA